MPVNSCLLGKKSRIFRTLRAQRSKRAGVSKPLSFETLHGGSAIRFLGSVYATARTSLLVNIFFLASSSRTVWQEKLDKDLDPRSAWEGTINSAPYRFTFSRLYILFISTVSYVAMNLSNLFCHIMLGAFGLRRSSKTVFLEYNVWTCIFGLKSVSQQTRIIWRLIQRRRCEQESFGVVAKNETDLKMKRLFRPR
jgi:hypothetical protein